MQLADLLARHGLPVELRLLVIAKVAIWPADWPRFEAAANELRHSGAGRTGIQETLLQAVLFYGFPRVVTAFERLAGVWPTEAAPSGGALPAGEQPAAGRALFAAIYGRNDAAVRAMLARHHGELHDFVLEAAYGRVLSRPALPPLSRELLAAGALAVMDQVPQLLAHARGALHFGADRTAVREVLVCALGDEARADGLLRRI